MKSTFNALLKDMDERGPHERREGRKSAHCIRDMISKGVGLMLSGPSDVDDDEMSGPSQDGVDTTARPCVNTVYSAPIVQGCRRRSETATLASSTPEAT